MLKSRLEKRQRQPDSDQEHRASTGSTCSNECTISDGSSLVTVEVCLSKRLKKMRESYKPDMSKINHFLSDSEVKTIEAIVNKFILSSQKVCLITCYGTSNGSGEVCNGNSASSGNSASNNSNANSNGHEARVTRSENGSYHESNECKSGADCNQKAAPPHLLEACDVIQNSPKHSLSHHVTHGPMPSIRHILHVLFTHIQQFVTFATDLPLFASLHHSDQQILLKESVLMMYLFKASFDFTGEEEPSSSPRVASSSSSSSSLDAPASLASFKKVKLDTSSNNNSECHHHHHETQQHKSSLTAQQICQLFGSKIYTKYISFVKYIHSLELDEVTILLISIVVLLNSNRKQLVESSMISQKQDQIVSILKSYLKWRYGQEAASLIFSRLFLKLPDLQELADTFHEFTFPSHIQQVEKIDSDFMAYTSSTKTCITASEEPMTWSLRTSLSASTANDFETQDLDYDSSCPSDASSSSSMATSSSTESANPISPV